MVAIIQSQLFSFLVVAGGMTFETAIFQSARSSAMREATVQILFPKFGLNSIPGRFSLDDTAMAILDFACETYTDIPLDSLIYCATDFRQFTYVMPEEVLSTLSLRSQHQFLIMPEKYDIAFVDNATKKEYKMKVSNGFYVSEVLQVICARNQLLNPRFYVVLSGSRELDLDETITEQAPFATSLNFQLAPVRHLYDLLTSDFIENKLLCNTKDVHFIAAMMLYVNFGPYKASDRSQYEKDVKALIPKQYQDDASFVKTAIKKVQDVYKKVKPTEDPRQETVDYIKQLQHFSSIVFNGDYQIGLLGKHPGKEKATFSLNFAVLRVFKQNAAGLLDQFNISEMLGLTLDGRHNLKFEYDIPDKGGKHTIRCRLEAATELYDTIFSRLRTPKDTGRLGSTTRHSSAGVISVSLPFVRSFNQIEEFPLSELSVTTIHAASVILAEVVPLIGEFAAGATPADRDKVELTPKVQVVLAFMAVVTVALASALDSAFDAFLTAVQTGTSQKDIATRTERLQEAILAIQDNFATQMSDRSVLPVRPLFVDLIRAAFCCLFTAGWVHERLACSEIIEGMKLSLQELIRAASNFSVYTGGVGDVRDEVHRFSELVGQLEKAVNRITNRAVISIVQKDAVAAWQSSITVFDEYFASAKPVTVIPPLALDSSTRIPPRDPRPLLTSAQKYVELLSVDQIEDIEEALAALDSLRSTCITLMGFSPQETHEPLVLAFNAFNTDVERAFASHGVSSAKPSARRCEAALESLHQSINPTPELRTDLRPCPPEDARVIALSNIIEYLDRNGPLFDGSPSHQAIRRFIAQMSTADASVLVELAYTIESYVPESLRQLSATCDLTRDRYKEVDETLAVDSLASVAESNAQVIGDTAAELRRALGADEKDLATRYRALNTRLWRLNIVFAQFATDEVPGSVGHTAFSMCSEAFKILIEECAYDMRRNRKFGPFIDEFTEKVDRVISTPHDSAVLAGLGAFLLAHQTRPGFFKAAKALSAFNHFVIVADSNHAAEDLIADLNKGQEFRSVSFVIAQLRRRFVGLRAKVDLAMKGKGTVESRPDQVDLRGDYHAFLIKYTEELFAIFSQLIVARSTNQVALHGISTGCDAIEKLFPLVMNVETPAPFLARSVCGILFSSLEAMTKECKEISAKAAQSANIAMLAVREFLFNVRRKISEAEQQMEYQMTGIGIWDMLAVLDRDQKVMKEQHDFQRSLRKHEWFQSPL
jgi:hypothetical protein